METITHLLTGIVNGDPALLALDIAKFESDLASVSAMGIKDHLHTIQCCFYRSSIQTQNYVMCRLSTTAGLLVISLKLFHK